MSDGGAFMLGHLARVIVSLALALLPSVAAAQYTPPDTPSGSPLWWPLFDGITAEELREAHQRQRVVARYRESVASGSSPDCGPDYAPAMFRDAEAHPELVPLWYQLYFGIVGPSVTIDDPRAPPELPVEKLRDSGMSPAGVDALGGMVGEVAEDVYRMRADLDSALASARQVLMDFEDRNPVPTPTELVGVASRSRSGQLDSSESERLESYRVFEEAAEGRGEPELIARLIGGNAAEWPAWLRLLQRQPVVETMELYLPGLRASLSLADWRALRRVLASGVGNNRTAEYSLLDCPEAFEFPY